ncbi:hypothetical protein [Pacificispira sp.]|uniref:hypothetical protein n=1 Tax=Pacificispira sp. TaxID=2888761 RepID=UPI003BAC1FEF
MAEVILFPVPAPQPSVPTPILDRLVPSGERHPLTFDRFLDRLVPAVVRPVEEAA